MREIYFSLDVETDGPIPGPHSMLSFGLAAFAPGLETPLSIFAANLDLLPDAYPHEDTQKFWNENSAAYEATRTSRFEPNVAMLLLRNWVKEVCERHNGKPVCVAYPASFDFMFLYWYLIKFGGQSPFGMQALDTKTLAFTRLPKKGFRETTKRAFKDHWIPTELGHTHIALDDAIEQGVMFIRILEEARPDIV